MRVVPFFYALRLLFKRCCFLFLFLFCLSVYILYIKLYYYYYLYKSKNPSPLLSALYFVKDFLKHYKLHRLTCCTLISLFSILLLSKPILFNYIRDYWESFIRLIDSYYLSCITFLKNLYLYLVSLTDRGLKFLSFLYMSPIVMNSTDNIYKGNLLSNFIHAIDNLNSHYNSNYISNSIRTQSMPNNLTIPTNNHILYFNLPLYYEEPICFNSINNLYQFLKNEQYVRYMNPYIIKTINDSQGYLLGYSVKYCIVGESLFDAIVYPKTLEEIYTNFIRTGRVYRRNNIPRNTIDLKREVFTDMFHQIVGINGRRRINKSITRFLDYSCFTGQTVYTPAEVSRICGITSDFVSLTTRDISQRMFNNFTSQQLLYNLKMHNLERTYCPSCDSHIQRMTNYCNKLYQDQIGRYNHNFLYDFHGKIQEIRGYIDIKLKPRYNNYTYTDNRILKSYFNGYHTLDVKFSRQFSLHYFEKRGGFGISLIFDPLGNLCFTGYSENSLDHNDYKYYLDSEQTLFNNLVKYRQS